MSGTIHGSGASAAVIVSKPGPILAPFAQSVAKPAREFRVCGLPRGEYLFEIISADGQGARLQAAQSVTVTNRDLDGMNVTLLPERSLRTRLVWDKADTPAAPVGRIEIALVDRRSSARLMTAPDATVPGSLRPATEPLLDYACLTTFSSPVVYIKDLRYGEESVLGRVMHSSGGVLTMVMARDGATVSATAMSGDEAEADASIAIMPVSSGSEAEFAAALQFGHTDQWGVWNSPLVAPGKYLAIATDEALDTTVFRIDRIWAARSKAKEIELLPNATLPVKLAVQNLGPN